MHNCLTFEPYPSFYDGMTEKKTTYPAYKIHFHLFIDGKEMYPHLEVDIFSILTILKKEYKYYHTLWNCDCGCVDCARIDQMLLLNEHSDETLHFKISEPITYNETNWENTRKVKILRINKIQLKNEFENLIVKLESILSNTKGFFMGYPAGYNSQDNLLDVPDFINKIRLQLNEFQNLKKI